MSYLTSRQRADLDAYLTRGPDEDPDIIMFPARQIKASRKEHRCYACGQAIPVGSRCQRFCGTENDKFFVSYTHWTCPGQED